MQLTITLTEPQLAALTRLNADYQTEVQPTIEAFTTDFITAALDAEVNKMIQKDFNEGVNILVKAQSEGRLSPEDYAALKSVKEKYIEVQ